MARNIWVAAGDGDLDRVTELIEQHSLSPNIPDPYTYTPMHAAASYGHLHILEYLISRGGDVNVTDGDGDTPLYTVENLETARFLVEHGATVARQNNEGLSPIDHLTEEFPQVADYLRHAQTPSPPDLTRASNSTPSQYSQNAASEQLTSGLMRSVQHIVEQAEVEGREPNEEELRQAVSRSVLEGVLAGYGMCEDDNLRDRGDTSTKRRRGEDSG